MYATCTCSSAECADLEEGVETREGALTLGQSFFTHLKEVDKWRIHPQENISLRRGGGGGGGGGGGEGARGRGRGGEEGKRERGEEREEA